MVLALYRLPNVVLLKSVHALTFARVLRLNSATALKTIDDEQYQKFLGTLGPGQLFYRQLLGTPTQGDVQLTIAQQKGKLLVEIIRVKDIAPNPSYKNTPSESNYTINFDRMYSNLARVRNFLS